MSATIEELASRKRACGIGNNVHIQIDSSRRPFCSCSQSPEVELAGVVALVELGLAGPEVELLVD